MSPILPPPKSQFVLFSVSAYMCRASMAEQLLVFLRTMPGICYLVDSVYFQQGIHRPILVGLSNNVHLWLAFT